MPSMADLRNDYIISSITSFSSQLTQHLFLDLNFNYEYHSLVPEKVQKQDIITSVTLRMKF
jgi:putative salt-induced outer membrane protein YdiY